MKPEHPTIRVTIGRTAPAPSAPATPTPRPPDGRPMLTPPIDIYEGPEGLILEADLPGVDVDHLTIQLEENILTLHATPTAEQVGNARLIHEEYRLGEFHRSFILSDEVDRNGISAELKHGVLRLTLPKAERARTRRIEVKSP